MDFQKPFDELDISRLKFLLLLLLIPLSKFSGSIVSFLITKQVALKCFVKFNWAS